MSFEVGQVFSPDYPPEAAIWCNESGTASIKEIEVGEDGQRRFQIVAIAAPALDDVKAEKLAELDAAFMDWYEKDATVMTSLGFVADSDSRAITDVTGLVTVLEAQPAETRSTVAFMDHDNVPHTLTLEQMKTVQLEIIQNGQSAYAQKWAYRSAIENAESVEALQVLKFEFTGEDFSNATAS